MTNYFKNAIALIALFGLFSVSTIQACDYSSLTITQVSDLGGGEYKIDMDFCVGGGESGATLATVDFWFEVYGSGVTLKANGFPATLNSGQSSAGCTSCRTAIAFHNSVGNYQTFANTCPPAGAACPSGPGTCVWYSANAPLAPNPATYFTTLGSPVAPTCPGPPPSGEHFPAYVDVYPGSGTGKAYCKSISFTTVGLPDSIRVKGLENSSGFSGYCTGSELVVFPSCSPFALSLGADETVFLGYKPMECADLTSTITGKTGPFTYAWSTGASTQSINVCPTATSTYTLTVTDNGTGCQVTDEITVSAVTASCGQGNSKKVNVCHDGKLKCVPTQQVQTHLDHGDKLGSCSQ